MRDTLIKALLAHAKGDIQIVNDEIEHQPYEAIGQDCVCLTITDGPLKFKKWSTKIIQPFIGI